MSALETDYDLAIRPSADSALELPPGPGLAPSRQTARWVMRPLAFLQEQQARYGDIFTMRLAGERPWVVISAPGLVKHVFQAPADVLHAGEAKQVLEPVLGANSLLLLDDDAHLAQRKLLLAPFRGDRVGGHEGVIRAVAEAAIARWPAGTVEPAAPLVRTAALEVIVRTVIGVDDDDDVARMRDAMRELHLPANRTEGLAPALQRRRANVDALLFAEIDRRRGDAALERRGDVLSLLLLARHQDGSAMSKVEIRDELMTLLVAGHETTVVTLCWALERLARSPSALARATADAEAGSYGEGSYIDAVIREALRMRPPLPFVARVVKRPFEIGGWTVPAGATIAPSILLLHHRPDLYPEPERFRPERFVERGPAQHTWIPFGGGARRCIGAGFAMFQARVFMAVLLARARVRATDADPEPMRARTVTLTPSRGARVALDPRR